MSGSVFQDISLYALGLYQWGFPNEPANVLFVYLELTIVLL